MTATSMSAFMTVLQVAAAEAGRIGRPSSDIFAHGQAFLNGFPVKARSRNSSGRELKMSSLLNPTIVTRLRIAYLLFLLAAALLFVTAWSGTSRQTDPSRLEMARMV